MAGVTLYPAALDDASTLPDTRTDNTPSLANHETDHNNLAAAVKAMQRELGVLPKGPWGDLAARLARIKPRTIYVEHYGAKGDGQMVVDLTMVAGSAVGTSPSNPFVAGQDENKVILVSGVAAGNADLVTTIRSVDSPGQVTLAAAAFQNSPDIPTARIAVYGTDDTAAIQAASDAAAAFLPQPAELEFDAKMYVVNGALQQGGARKTNAQITLPDPHGPAGGPSQRQFLAWRGAPGSASGTQQMLFPQGYGTSLVSFIQGASYSAAYGIPSVIGSSTQEQSTKFNGLFFELSDMRVIAPRNPTVAGINLENCGGQNRRRMHIGTLQWGYATASLETLGEPQHPQACGFIEPRTTNFQNAGGIQEETYIWGYYAGVSPSEHADWRATRIATCRIPIALRSGAGNKVQGISHAMNLGYVSMEGNPYGISGWDPTAATTAAGTVGVNAAHARIDVTLDIEDYTDNLGGHPAWRVLGNNVNDPGNALYGRIRYARMTYINNVFTTTQALVVSGGANLTLMQLDSPVTVSKLTQFTQGVIDSMTPWTIQLWAGIGDFSPTLGAWNVAALNNAGAIHGGEWYNTAPAVGDEVGWDLMLAKGTWNFAALVGKGANAGILQLFLDGVAIGTTFDGYNTSVLYNQTYGAWGIAVATNGKHRLSIRVTGKNAASSNYYAILQGIQCRRTA